MHPQQPHTAAGSGAGALPPAEAAAAAPPAPAPASAGDPAATGPATVPTAPPSLPMPMASLAQEARPRPHQKTPEQKQALEEAFQINAFPNDVMRRIVAEKVGLTEQQVQTWFSHRRRRDRQEKGADSTALTPGSAGPRSTGPTAVPPQPGSGGAALPMQALQGKHEAADEEMQGYEEEEEGPDPVAEQRLAEYQELLAAAAATLPVPLRPEGPPLGLEFDEFPTAGAAGAKGGRRRKAEDDPDFEMDSKRQRPAAPRPRSAVLGPGDLERLRAEEEMRASMLADRARTQMERLEATILREQERMARDKERSDMRLAREREKELARLEGERRKHLEKVMKERRKEEERRIREAARLQALQEKEEKRLAIARERELRAEEKKREKEEKRREREVMKALTQVERNALRQRVRDTPGGSKDDVDLEWDALLAEYRSRHSVPPEVVIPRGGPVPDGFPPLPQLAPFPPPSVKLHPAGPAELGESGAGPLLSVWSTLSAFSYIVGVAPPTVDELLAALAAGTRSALLADLHIGMLRLLQADAEEGHATGEGAAPAGDDKREDKKDRGHLVVPGVRLLEEAWAWGFDVDTWRAHLNRLTWPEIGRQVAVAAGLGRRRPQPRREDRFRMGVRGEDIVIGGGQDGMELRLPPRLTTSSVKGSAWLVLRDAGYEGMHVEEIAKQIQSRGLRDLRTSKTPESSVAGALGRDVLFERIAPATYALQSIRAHTNRLKLDGGSASKKGPLAEASEGAATPSTDAKGVKPEPAAGGTGGAGAEGTPAAAGGGGAGGEGSRGVKAEPGGHGEEEEEDYDDEEGEEEDEEEEEEERRRRDEAHAGEGWVAALLDSDYDSLPLEHRVAMLFSLCHLILDGPTVRGALERRMEEQSRLKRALIEETRVAKHVQQQRKQAEALMKAKQQAEEAQRSLDELRAAMNGMAAQPPVAPGGSAPTQLQLTDGRAAPMDVETASAAPAAAPAAAAEPAAQPPPGGSAEKRAAESSRATELAVKLTQQEALGPEALKQRSLQLLGELEANAVRAEPLGTDRRHNRYWRFVAGPLTGGEGSEEAGSVDACAGRVFVESHVDGGMQLLCTKEDLDALEKALNQKAVREGVLYTSLVRYKDSLSRSMPTAPLALPAAAPPPPSPAELDAAVPSAAAAIAAAPGAAAIRAAQAAAAPELAKLKVDMMGVHAALPVRAVDASFDAAAWGERVASSPGPAALRRCLGELEAAIAADCMHPEFRKDPLLVKGAWIAVGREIATALPGTAAPDVLLPAPPPGSSAAAAGGDGGHGEDGGAAAASSLSPRAAAEPLGWLPPTLPAVALRLYALDAALKYRGNAAARDELEGYRFMLRPAPGSNAAGCVLRGMPLERQGRIRPVLFPPFPYRLLCAPRTEFSFPIPQFQADVEAGSDALVGASTAARASRGGTALRNRGRPKGTRNRGQRSSGAGTAGGGTQLKGLRRPRGGGMPRGISSGPMHAGAMPSEAQRSDSERAYGSDFDGGEEEYDYDPDDFVSAPTGAGPPSYNPSAGPSVAASLNGDDPDDVDEEISEDEGSDVEVV